MSGKNEVMRQAAMFTMNGLPDPRLFAVRAENQEPSTSTDKSFYSGLSRAIRAVVEGMSRRALREKNAH